MKAHELPVENPFLGAMEKFMEVAGKLQVTDTMAMPLRSLEASIENEGREILRLLLQKHIQLRGPCDISESVVCCSILWSIMVESPTR